MTAELGPCAFPQCPRITQPFCLQCGFIRKARATVDISVDLSPFLGGTYSVSSHLHMREYLALPESLKWLKISLSQGQRLLPHECVIYKTVLKNPSPKWFYCLSPGVPSALWLMPAWNKISFLTSRRNFSQLKKKKIAIWHVNQSLWTQ